MIINLELFGDTLRRLRFLSGKTAVQMAKDCRVSRSTLQSWEGAEGLPGVNKLPRIASSYDIDLDKLTQVFRLSKDARRREWSARRVPKTINRKQSLWTDEIGSRFDLERMNGISLGWRRE